MNAQGLAKRLAQALHGQHFKIEDLRVEDLMGILADHAADQVCPCLLYCFSQFSTISPTSPNTLKT